MRSRLIFWLYLVVAAVNLVAQITDSADLNRFTKPVLMPLLLFYIYEVSKGRVTIRVLLLCIAILFSWFGDIALMYQAQSNYFLLGVGLFLIAHITYIVVLKKFSFNPLQFDVLRVLPFAVYAVGLFNFLLPNAGDFAIPILVYGIVISVMAGTARLREGNTLQESYRLAFYGSLLFLVSDSILAVNKFYQEIPLAGLWVMSTYIAAQLLLVSGLLKHTD